MEIIFYHFDRIVNGSASLGLPCKDIENVLWNYELKTKLILI